MLNRKLNKRSPKIRQKKSPFDWIVAMNKPNKKRFGDDSKNLII